MKVFSIILLILALAGCAQIPSFRDIDDLDSFESDVRFVLNDDVIYEERKGFVDWFYGLRKGTYLAKYEDRQAYYFFGDGFAACNGTKGKSNGCTSPMTGGIWVSKKDPNDIRVFYMADSSGEEPKVNMGWIFYLTSGSITVQTPNPSFAERISALKVTDDN